MELKDVLYQMMNDHQNATQPADLRVGTVTAVNPLEVTINTAMAPLKAGILLLTEPVVEKKIPILQHNHVIHDTYTGGGTSEDNLMQSDIICYENGTALPVQNGYIILNRALEVGDIVLLLRVQNGQKFVVLSRVMEA